MLTVRVGLRRPRALCGILVSVRFLRLIRFGRLLLTCLLVLGIDDMLSNLRLLTRLMSNGMAFFRCRLRLILIILSRLMICRGMRLVIERLLRLCVVRANVHE